MRLTEWELFHGSDIMEVRKGSFGNVSIDHVTKTVKKKENLREGNVLDIQILTDCIMSTFISSIGCSNLPSVKNILINADYDEVGIVMPYSGLPLHDWIQRTSTNERIAKIPTLLLQLIHACEVLHSYNIQHTDVKPANILIDPCGKLTLIDFNMLSIYTPHHGWSQSVGTWCYIAPEILFTDQPSDTSVVWSIGIILAEIVRGFPMGNIKHIIKDVNDRTQWQRIMQVLRKRCRWMPLSSKHIELMCSWHIQVFNSCTVWNSNDRPSLQMLKNKIIQSTPNLNITLQHNPVQSHGSRLCFVNPGKNLPFSRDDAIDKIQQFCSQKINFGCLLFHSIYLLDLLSGVSEEQFKNVPFVDMKFIIPTLLCLTYVMSGFQIEKSFFDNIHATFCPGEIIFFDDIETNMVHVCVALRWQLYYRGADIIVTSNGMSYEDVVSILPDVMKHIDCPYSNTEVVDGLYKARALSECTKHDSHDDGDTQTDHIHGSTQEITDSCGQDLDTYKVYTGKHLLSTCFTAPDAK